MRATLHAEQMARSATNDEVKRLISQVNSHGTTSTTAREHLAEQAERGSALLTESNTALEQLQDWVKVLLAENASLCHRSTPGRPSTAGTARTPSTAVRAKSADDSGFSLTPAPDDQPRFGTLTPMSAEPFVIRSRPARLQLPATASATKQPRRGVLGTSLSRTGNRFTPSASSPLGRALVDVTDARQPLRPLPIN
jgi:hypothetical protein